ncbi:MAG: YgjV family protein [Clostridia bacterium]|nr:YgjV family protein [Clostridia bacterium]
MYILSQIFVVVSCVLFAVSYLFKKKSIILIFSILNNLFFGAHFLLLKSYTASCTVFLTIFFLTAVYFVEKLKKENLTILVTVIFLIALIPITILTWSGIISLFPTFGTIMYFTGTTFNKTLFLKIFYLISTISNTIFMYVIHSYFGCASNLLIVAFGIYGLIREIQVINNSKKKV